MKLPAAAGVKKNFLNPRMELARQNAFWKENMWELLFVSFSGLLFLSSFEQLDSEMEEASVQDNDDDDIVQSITEKRRRGRFFH